MAEVTLKGIVKSFDATRAVDDVDLTVHDGEFFSLLGPSGCGKSTLLHIVCGLLRQDAGEVLIDGRDVGAAEPKERGVAMVFQDYALYPHMTIFDNLAFPLRAEGGRRRRREEIRRRVHEAAEPLELTGLLDRLPRELSGGQRQRVALGRAMVRDPKVFLMDEPLSNLDARLRTQMRTELRMLQQRLNATVIYVTHDQAEAMTLSDRMAVMSAGRVQQSGVPIDVYDRPDSRFVATFLGDTGMNLLRGTLAREDGRALWRSGALEWELSPAQAAAASALGDGRPIELAFRPEAAVVTEPHEPAWGRGVLVLREQLGSEQHLHVDVDGHAVVVRTGPHLRLAADAPVAIALRSDQVHVLDEESGLRLDQGAAEVAEAEGLARERA